MLAKLLPEDGFLRLEPAWKWNALENGNKGHGYSPLYVEPTSNVSSLIPIHVNLFY